MPHTLLDVPRGSPPPRLDVLQLHECVGTLTLAVNLRECGLVTAAIRSQFTANASQFGIVFELRGVGEAFLDRFDQPF